MSIQIIITGDHATDALGELLNLASALIPQSKTQSIMDVDEQSAKELAQINQQADRMDYTPLGATNNPVKDQDGRIDVGYSHVPTEQESEKPKRGRKKKDASVENIQEVTPKEENIADHFSTAGEDDCITQNVPSSIPEPKESAFYVPAKVDTSEEVSVPGETSEQVISHDTLVQLVVSTGKTETGSDDPEKYAQMRGVITRYVPQGVSPKISNIPADKVKEVYYEISAL